MHEIRHVVAREIRFQMGVYNRVHIDIFVDSLFEQLAIELGRHDG